MNRRYFVSVLLLFVLPVMFFMGVTAVLQFSFPDTITSPLFTKSALALELLSSNFQQGLKWLFIEVPLFAIEARRNSEVIWGLYWNILNTLALVVVAFFYARIFLKWSALYKEQRRAVVASLLLCWLVTFDLWLTGCCNAGPQWWPEVLLLSKAYVSNPYLDTINWQGLYQRVTDIAVVLKLLLVTTAMGLLWWPGRENGQSKTHNRL